MAKDEVKIRFAAETKDFNDGIKNMNSDIAGLRSELKLNSTQLKASAGNTSLLKERQELLSSELEKSKEKIELTNAKLQKAKEIYGENSQVVKQYEKDLTEAKNQEAAIQNELRNTTKELIEQKYSLTEASEKITAFGEGCEAAGEKMIAVTGAIAGIAVAAGKTAMDFEDSMAKVNTIADDSAVEINDRTTDMETAIKELSNETGIAATEIAESVYNSISAGQKTADSVTFVQTATKLAEGGFTEVGNAVDLLTTILNAYGMEASEVNTVSDMLINTQNLGKTTVADLSSAMGKIIPTANATNTSLDQLCAGYALMTANGVATAETTTYMNGMLNELSKTGSDVDVVLREKTGKSFSELMDNGSSLADCLAIIDEHAKEQNLTMSDMFSSSEAAKAGLILLGDSANTFNETVKAMQDSTGATNKAFETVSDTVSYKGNVALNEIKNTGIELGTTLLNELAPAIDEACDKVQAAADWFSDLNSEQQSTIIAVGGIVAAAGPALIVIGKVAQGVGAMTKAVGAAKTAWATYTAGKAAATAATTASTVATTASTAATTGATVAQTGLNTAMLASPVTWVVLAIVGLVAAFVVLWNKCEGFRNFWIGLWENIKSAATSIAEGVKGVIEGISDGFSKLKEGASQYVWSIKDTFNENGGGIKGAAAVYVKLMTDQFKLGYDALNTLTGGKLEQIKSVATEKFQGIKDKASENLSKIVSNTSQYLSSVKSTFDEHGGGIQGAAAVYMKLITDQFRNGYNTLNSLTKGRLGDMVSSASEKITALKDKFKKGVDKIKEIFNFKLKAPDIRMPSITVSWTTTGALAEAAKFLGLQGLPKFGIKWNAEGAILKKPMIFGFANGMLQGGGEAGEEAVLPIEKLQAYIDNGMEKYISNSSAINYEKLEEVFTRAVLKTNQPIVLNNRVAARIKRSLG